MKYGHYPERTSYPANKHLPVNEKGSTQLSKKLVKKMHNKKSRQFLNKELSKGEL